MVTDIAQPRPPGDNLSAHKGDKVREWATTNDAELAYTPFYASWLNRIEAQFRALR